MRARSSRRGRAARRSPAAWRCKAELEGRGRSPAAFFGSLSGSGSIALRTRSSPGLNPRVFDAVIRAAELGMPTDGQSDPRLRHRRARHRRLQGRKPRRRSIGGGPGALFQRRYCGRRRRTQVAGNSISPTATLDAVLTLSGAPASAGAARPTLLVGAQGALPAPGAPSMPNAGKLAGVACGGTAVPADRRDGKGGPGTTPPAVALDTPPAAAAHARHGACRSRSHITHAKGGCVTRSGAAVAATGRRAGAAAGSRRAAGSWRATGRGCVAARALGPGPCGHPTAWTIRRAELTTVLLGFPSRRAAPAASWTPCGAR